MKNISYIQNIASDYIREVFNILEIDFIESYGYLHSACPVHNGDNPRGLFWHIDSKHWECMTRNCHRNPITGPSSSVFGLVRGVMSNKTGSPWSFDKSVRFLLNALNITPHDSHINDNNNNNEINKIINEYRLSQKILHPNIILLASVLPKLQKDTVYYPNRGISQDIINKYHISYCNIQSSKFYKRAFFPILTEDGQYVLGWSGRSTNGQLPKWKHSNQFKANHCLYNYWFAKNYIQKTHTAIVCEGPQDVWKLEMADIHNSVALFHLNVSKQQRLLLQRAGALTLVLALDNDQAGTIATNKLIEDLNSYFRVIVVQPTKKDIGEMSINDINKLFKIYGE